MISSLVKLERQGTFTHSNALIPANGACKKPAQQHFLDALTDPERNKYSVLDVTSTHDNILALLLLPLCFSLPKTYNKGKDFEITITTVQISKSFDFHENEADKVDAEKNKFEAWLTVIGMFRNIMQHVEQLNANTDIISNTIQADFWKSKFSTKFANDIVLPLYIFHDKLETGNGMGPHAEVNEFGPIYSSIACLPPNVASRLSSILLIRLIHSEDKKKCTNRKVSSKLIKELNMLQKNEIIINVNGVLKRVKFQSLLILGDNLGLSEIFVFVESFKAFFFCRICKTHSSLTAKMTVEDVTLLRTKENYKEDVQKADASSTGVKESCAFHEVKNFHLTENSFLTSEFSNFSKALENSQTIRQLFPLTE
ncbi:hypothetical protein TSAR_015125 [Trichomalopsis sarcophagae]|uniref:Uncharacterized protein n=1 Tax=Trichomalopsis sarcophagae TaxID=543379 RepID=A0A232EL42_9HYME|nr:hypothetical protein TSAR_015125 [Trichomalopsis sarcophagae]